MIVKVARGDGSWAQPLWAADYVNELADFDKGVHDDQVDASSIAYNKAVEQWNARKGRRARVTTVAGRNV